MATGRGYASRSVRHQIYLQRYNAGVVRQMLALLNRTDRDIVARLRDMPDVASQRALNDVLAQIQVVTDQLTADFGGLLREAVGGLSIYEAQFARELGQAVSGVQWAGPTIEQVRAAALSRPFAGAQLSWANLGDQLDEYGRRRAALVRDTIRRGFLEGDSVDELVSRLVGSSSLNYRDGILEASRRTAETIVRTALNHTANAAREEVYKANQHLISGVRWTAILDGRTSAVCRGRDGEVYPLDSGPRPPAHPNCRSTTVPVFDGEDPPNMPTYSQWLREQDREFVEEVLGKQKAALFLDGKLSLDRFIDNAGHEYTLDQLRTRDAAAFKRAKL